MRNRYVAADSDSNNNNNADIGIQLMFISIVFCPATGTYL